MEKGNIQLEFKKENHDDFISISTILEMLQTPFDQTVVAEKTYNKHYNNPESEYYMMSIDDIVNKWKEKGKVSMQYGKMNDEYIGIVLEGSEEEKELFMLDYDVENDQRLKIQVQAFDDFITHLPDNIKYVCRENTVWLKTNKGYIKGRFDALFYNELTKKWIVVDWKTSGTIDTKPNQWTKKLLGTAKALDALNWITYTIQTYFYKTALIDNGYLPEGTNYDDIQVCIVNFPGKQFEDGKLYKVYGPAFKYDRDYLYSIFEFGITKNKILNKK